jgi:hypothetical protein
VRHGGEEVGGARAVGGGAKGGRRIEDEDATRRRTARVEEALGDERRLQAAIRVAREPERLRRIGEGGDELDDLIGDGGDGGGVVMPTVGEDVALARGGRRPRGPAPVWAAAKSASN